MKARFRNKVARQRRKEGADVRKAAHDKLTLKQKLDKAVGKREQARLEVKLNKGMGAMPPPEFAHEMGMTAEQIQQSRKKK